MSPPDAQRAGANRLPDNTLTIPTSYAKITSGSARRAGAALRARDRRDREIAEYRRAQVKLANEVLPLLRDLEARLRRLEVYLLEDGRQ